MTRITCKQAAEDVLRQLGIERLTPENFDDNLETEGEYLAGRIEDASLDFAKNLSDENKFWVWSTCDDSLPWNDGISFYGIDSSRSDMLTGLAGWSIYLTIKSQARPRPASV